MRRPPSGPRPFPRVVIAAAASAAGKTSVTAGVVAALRARGDPVAPFKCGPDFLDPQVLRAAARAPTCPNLDLWLTPPRTLLRSFWRHGESGPTGINLVEGVMGVWDTSSWGTSTADVARTLRAPIVLVVDAARSAESVALQVRGAQGLLPRNLLGGVIVNRVGRGWHASAVRAAIEERCRVPVVGLLPWSEEIRLPEQHLGLATPETRPGVDWGRSFQALAGWAREGIDLDRLARIARSAPDLPEPAPSRAPPTGALSACVAVASDPAFCFAYPENLESIRDRGARVETFSPVAGDSLPPSCGAVYLPGGYPETHARRLSENERLRRELRDWATDGRPLLAECGGMMFMLDELVDAEGTRYRMAGAFRGTTRMQPRLAGFGYGEAVLARTSLMGHRADRIRGHIYHHSQREDCRPAAWGWTFRPRNGSPGHDDGLTRGRSVASYLHIRLDAYPKVVDRLVGGSA